MHFTRVELAGPSLVKRAIYVKCERGQSLTLMSGTYPQKFLRDHEIPNRKASQPLSTCFYAIVMQCNISENTAHTTYNSVLLPKFTHAQGTSIQAAACLLFEWRCKIPPPLHNKCEIYHN